MTFFKLVETMHVNARAYREQGDVKKAQACDQVRQVVSKLIANDQWLGRQTVEEHTPTHVFSSEYLQ
jgi:predicted metal-dependent enzyme (double-stranded beta helix superfamily)